MAYLFTSVFLVCSLAPGESPALYTSGLPLLEIYHMARARSVTQVQFVSITDSNSFQPGWLASLHTVRNIARKQRLILNSTLLHTCGRPRSWGHHLGPLSPHPAIQTQTS